MNNKISILDEPVSYYNNYKTSHSNGIVILREWLTSDVYKTEIVSLRRATKEKRDGIKATLPAITISGVFEPTRKTENLKYHSGLICIDIDQQDNPHIPNVTGYKQRFPEINCVAYCGLSASGKGLFVIIPIECPALHKEYFMELERIFKKAFNITIDKNCKDVTRLRGASYDPAPYINDNATVFTKLPQPEIKGSFGTYTGAADNTIVNNIFGAVMRQKIDLTENRENWFQICSVLVNTLGESGRSIFHGLSSFHPRYKEQECNRLYSDLLARERYSYSIGTLVYIAKECGVGF